MNNIFKKLEEEIKKISLGDASGHDFYHLKRVMNLAQTLQKKEGGDLEIILISALVHDVHRLIQNQSGDYCQPKDSLPRIREILEKIGLKEDTIKKVLHCVEFHEPSEEKRKINDIETLIIQDADRLDALGAIGIARAFCYGGATHNPMWIPEMPIRNKFSERDNFNSESQIHHFYAKLLNLKDTMNTNLAKKMALKRHEYMKKYLKEFFAEWEGKI